MEALIENITVEELKSLTEEQALENIETIIFLKKRREQEVRDLVSEILDKISQDNLLKNFDIILNLIRAPYYFVREEAERLLDKISPELLFDRFEDLFRLQIDPDYGIQRFAKKTMLKIAAVWPLKQKQLHYMLIVEWQQSTDKKTREVGNLLALQVMQDWKTELLKDYLPFLIQCTNLDENDCLTSELAASLAFRVLSKSTLGFQKDYLDYMTSFDIYAEKELRRKFRHLALETIHWSPVDLSRYSIFFLRCLEGKNKNDRTMAWKFLLQINPDELPVCELVYRQSSGLYRVRAASKKLAKRVGASVLLENLGEFLRLQDSDYCGVRGLSRQLILKIPLEMIKKKRSILEECSNSPYFGASVLSEVLLNAI